MVAEKQTDIRQSLALHREQIHLGRPFLLARHRVGYEFRHFLDLMLDPDQVHLGRYRSSARFLFGRRLLGLLLRLDQVHLGRHHFLFRFPIDERFVDRPDALFRVDQGKDDAEFALVADFALVEEKQELVAD